jgi:phosphocarrier protein HPr
VATVEQTCTLTNAVGLHARPASLLVQLAARFQSSIQLTSSGRTADAKRILQVLQLGAECGAEVRIQAEGDDAAAAVAALAALIAERFGEPE